MVFEERRTVGITAVVTVCVGALLWWYREDLGISYVLRALLLLASLVALTGLSAVPKGTRSVDVLIVIVVISLIGCMVLSIAAARGV